MSKISSKHTNIQFFENFKKWRIFIFISVFIVYGNTVFNKYSLDDEFVIKNNTQVHKGIKAIPEIFTTQYFTDRVSSFGYRPFTKATFAIEYQLFKENPAISHLINILLFAITSIVLLNLLIRLILPKTGTVFLFVVMTFWIAHPIHTEVVASLKNREEILYFLFCLLSLKYFMDYAENHNLFKLFFALILFVFGYLSKQSAISFGLIIPMVLWYKYVKFENIKTLFKQNIHIIFSVSVLIVVTILLYKMPIWLFPPDKVELASFENQLRFNFHTKLERLSVALYSFFVYLKLMIFPHPLVFYYGQFTIPTINIKDFTVIFSLLLHLTFLFFVIKYLKKKSVIIFGTLFFYLGILPFSNYYMTINGVVAERFLYAPSLGFIIVITFIIFKITKSDIATNKFNLLKSNTKYVVLIIVTLYTIKAIARNTSWKDSFTLYSNDIEYIPNSVKANDILAQTIMDRLMSDNYSPNNFIQIKPTLDSIINYYSKSLELYSQNPKALNNIANIYVNFYNKPEKALPYLFKAYNIKSNSYEVTFNIAKCYEMLKDDNLAAKFYNITIQSFNKNPEVWNNLIATYFRLNKNDSAKFICEKMLETDSVSDVPYIGLGFYYISNKDTLSAIKNWEIAVEKNPQNYKRCESLSIYYQIHKDTVKANYYRQKAFEGKILSAK